eukprot:scaffold26749_cov27-Tisochrysis_lutea.AAC.5
MGDTRDVAALGSTLWRWFGHRLKLEVRDTPTSLLARATYRYKSTNCSHGMAVAHHHITRADASVGLGVTRLMLLANAFTRSPTSATKSRMSTSFSISRQGSGEATSSDVSPSLRGTGREAAWMEKAPPSSPSLSTGEMQGPAQLVVDAMLID